MRSSISSSISVRNATCCGGDGDSGLRVSLVMLPRGKCTCTRLQRGARSPSKGSNLRSATAVVASSATRRARVRRLDGRRCALTSTAHCQVDGQPRIHGACFAASRRSPRRLGAGQASSVRKTPLFRPCHRRPRRRRGRVVKSRQPPHTQDPPRRSPAAPPARPPPTSGPAPRRRGRHAKAHLSRC